MQEKSIPSDESLVEAFFKSPTWKRNHRFLPFKHKNGIRELVRSFLREQHGVSFKERTPLAIEQMTGRVTKLVHSQWGSKAGQTRKARRKEAEKAAQEAYISPLLFGSSLPEQKKPPRKIA